MSDRICSVPGCPNELRARGWCATHWARWRKYGDPLGMNPVRKLQRDLHARVYSSIEVDLSDPDGCWLWNRRVGTFGYGMVSFNGANVGAHRLMYQLRVGPIPEGMFVCHRCDNPPCCNPEHLFLGTTEDNTSDKMTKGREARGEMVNTCKLTEADVLAIRADPRKYADICNDYGIGMSQVSRIKRRESWKHI